MIAQLGDPRLIAKTLLDTDTGEEVYEESRSYSESDAGNYGNQQEKPGRKTGSFHLVRKTDRDRGNWQSLFSC